MKKHILFILTLVFAHQCFAQSTVGLKGGMNLATIKSDFALDFNYKVGYHFGGFARAKIEELVGVQSELLFNSKGAGFDATSLSAEGKYVLNYISVPVMVRITPVERMGILLGPELGYLVSARSKGDGFNNDVKDALDFPDLDIGIALGIEYQSEGGIGFGVRYTHGLSHMQEYITTTSAGLVATDNKDWYNRTFQLYVCYAFVK